MSDKDIIGLVEECFDNQDRLNDWEYNFVANLYGRRPISIKQYELLLKIWKKVTKASN